jgi:DNA-binding Lrp family transcriptional regulator
MDEIDKKIIKVLLNNSRISFRNLSKQVGLSTDTVIRRYEKLESEGAIRPIITVDYEKLGYQGVIFYFIRVFGHSDINTISAEIQKIPDVVSTLTASGLYDLMANACFRNIKHAFEIGRRIKQIPNIKKVTIDLLWVPPPDIPMFPPPGWNNLEKTEI